MENELSMPDTILALEMNRAMVAGDIETLFDILAQHMHKHKLKIPRHIARQFHEMHLIEQQQ